MFSRQGIYMGWLGRRNLGDEAIFHICEDRFPSIHWRAFESLNYEVSVKRFTGKSTQEKGYLWRTLRDEFQTGKRSRSVLNRLLYRTSAALGGEVGILGGGTVLNRAGAASYVKVRQRTGRPVPTFGTGVANPRFWSQKSDWVDKRQEWAAALAELPVIGVRGPYSQGLLQEVGLGNVVVCGDPAIAFHEPIIGSAVREGKLRIAINTGDCSGHQWGTSLEPVQEALGSVARSLAKQGHAVDVIPVYPKDVPSSLDVVKRAGLPSTALLPVHDREDDYLMAMRRYDIIIALKLHAGILAAAANVPFVLLEYQPKALDFAASIGCEHLTLRTDATTPASLMARVQQTITERNAIRQHLCKRMCVLRSDFEAYCVRLETMLLS